MSNVQFDEPDYSYNRPTSPGRAGTVVNFIVERGWLKDRHQANIALLLISIIIFVVAISMFIGTQRNQITSLDELLPPEHNPSRK